jgi:hypothetical protein
MKKIIILFAAIIIFVFIGKAQSNIFVSLQALVTQLDKAVIVKDYEQLGKNFQQQAESKKTDWLPFYYAAYCNAKIGWLNQDNPDNIESYANNAEALIEKSFSLIDTASQKDELSEIYCVLSMTNRSRVFMNPVTYGRKYGPVAARYTQAARNSNPANPRALYLEGWEKFSTPKLWGGSKTKAKELLDIAKQKLDAESSSTLNPHWGKKEVDELLTILK